MRSLFKKTTREERIEKRISDVFMELTKAVEVQFTELETVQILNAVRRKTDDWLDAKKSECFELSINYQQKANEIKNAQEFLE